MSTISEVIEELPRLLKEHPEFKSRLYGILSLEYVTREDFLAYMKQSDERFDKILERIDLHAEETNHRFEEIDRRFEEVNRRFEEVNQRFEEMREEMNQRFAETREEMDRRFEEVNQRIEDSNDWVGTVVGGFQVRAGRGLEDAIAGTLRIALRRRDVGVENIRLRQKFTDDEGLIGKRGRSYEIDLCVSNSESIIFEIKSYGDREAVERFADKAEVAAKKLQLAGKISKVFLTLEKRPEVAKACKELGIILA